MQLPHTYYDVRLLDLLSKNVVLSCGKTFPSILMVMCIHEQTDDGDNILTSGLVSDRTLNLKVSSRQVRHVSGNFSAFLKAATLSSTLYH